MDKLLTLKQAAEKLQISKGHLRKMIKLGKIKALIVSKRGDKRFTTTEVERFSREAFT